MTTQELKQHIDKVLGNNIRCLLPSYWWRRLFSLTLEKVDEKLDATNIKTINGESIVGEGNLKVGVTTVGSIDELNTLEASFGDIATVGEESTMLVSVGDLPQVNVPHEILEKWDNLTRIVKVEFGEPVTENGRQAIVYLNGKKPFAYDTILITSSEGVFSCGYAVAGALREITIEEVNERLKKHDYRFMMGSNGDVIDRAFKLHAYSASADAYIKSDSWEKLAKEYVVSSEEELNALDVENGTIAKVAGGLIQINIGDCYLSTDYEKDWDKYTIIKSVEEKNNAPSEGGHIQLFASTSEMPYGKSLLVGWDGDGHGYGQYVNDTFVRMSKDEFNQELAQDDYRFVFGYKYKDIGSCFNFYTKSSSADAYIKGETWTRFLKEGDVTGGGVDITIDSELSDTSENAVQNKAVKAYVDEKLANVEGLEIREFYTGDSLTDEQKAWNLETFQLFQENKCFIVLDSGSGLLPLSWHAGRSFVFQYGMINTVTLNYEITVSEDGSTTTRNVNYLPDEELSTTSANVVSNKVITAALNEKVGKSDIKTINGESILGEGNIVVNADTSTLATKEELNAYATSESLQSLGLRIQNDMDTDKRELTEAINTKQDKIDDLEAIRSGAALGATALQEHQDISHLATKEEVIANEEVTAAALNDLNDRISELAENVQGETVTKEEFETAVNNLNDSLSGKADAQTTSEALMALSGQVETLSGQVETAVTSEQLSSAVDNINNTILENEEITAAALNDLKSQIIEIITRLNNGGL